MKRALISPENCRNCHECNVATLCPQKAIIQEEPTDQPWIDFYKCRGCMKCKQFCANGAVLEELKPCDGSFAQTW
jgi:Pyruvate/2-oxoacid:ferredoxin oxidoreductase delta subunit